MILHENRLLADDSDEISYLIFFQKLGKILQNLSSAAVVICILLQLLISEVVSEDISSTDIITRVKATDADEYDSLTFELNGKGAEKFRLDKFTGLYAIYRPQHFVFLVYCLEK